MLETDLYRAKVIDGDVAQLGERRPCKAEVVGSSPIVSTGMNLVKNLIHTVDGDNQPRYSTRPAEMSPAHQAARSLTIQKKSKWHLNCVFRSEDQLLLVVVFPLPSSIKVNAEFALIKELLPCWSEVPGQLTVNLGGQTRKGVWGMSWRQ